MKERQSYVKNHMLKLKDLSKKIKSLNANSKKVIELTDQLNAEKEKNSRLAKSLADIEQENEALRKKNNELIRRCENLSDKSTDIFATEMEGFRHGRSILIEKRNLNFRTEMEGGDEEIDQDEFEL